VPGILEYEVDRVSRDNTQSTRDQLHSARGHKRISMETSDITEYIIAYIQGMPINESNEQQRDVQSALEAYIDYTDTFGNNLLRYYDEVFYPRDVKAQEQLLQLRSFLTYSTISVSLVRVITDDSIRILLLSILRGLNLPESITSIFPQSDIQIYIDTIKRLHKRGPELMFFGDVSLMLTDREFLQLLTSAIISTYFNKAPTIYDETLAALWAIVLNNDTVIAETLLERDSSQRKLARYERLKFTYDFIKNISSRNDQTTYLRVLELDNMENVTEKSRAIDDKIENQKTFLDAINNYITLYNTVVNELQMFLS
jgi:hypothetical protein